MSDPLQTDPSFEALIDYLHRQYGLDFRGYKRTSLRRRFDRRMRAIDVPDYLSYLAFLEAEPREYRQLVDSVLINVTSFFRDEAAWRFLEKSVVPKILGRLSHAEPIRIWTAGCATGEEAYSLVILLARALGERSYHQRVKIYATDLDEDALAAARLATYGPESVQALPGEMLNSYFEESNGRFTIRRELRKTVIFGRHNLLTDAPISRIQLLSCRNLLIYLNSEAQARVLPRLHYALADDGFLFLGKAETQLAQSKLFEPVDLKSRVFRKRGLPPGRSNGASGDIADGRSPAAGALPGIIDLLLGATDAAALAVDAGGALQLATPAAQKLFGLGPGDIGSPFHDLQVSYRPIELRGRIEEAASSRRPIRVDGVVFERGSNEAVRLDIELVPAFGPIGEHTATAIVFRDVTRLHDLQQRLTTVNAMLDTTVEELQSTNEELETSNEEIQSTNEELETTNEELQSANEELETINEELQSTNDALEGANDALRGRTDDLERYQTHVETVFAAIPSGIIVLDDALRVTAWNRWCENTWGLRRDEVVGQRLADLDIGLPLAISDTTGGIAFEGRTPRALDLETLNRRGRSLTCRVTITPLQAADGQPRGAVIVVDDRATSATEGSAP